MAIILDQQETQGEKSHRRRGGAFDTLAKILRSIDQAIFRNGSVIADRPGDTTEASFVSAPSVFEQYQQRKAVEGWNLFVVGRRGTGDNKNTNYYEVNVDALTDRDRQSANGQYRINLSKDGEKQESAMIFYQLDTAVGAEAFSGPRILFTTSEQDGANAGTDILHYDSDGNFKFGIAIDSDGIQMAGLPTTNPGGTGRIWSDAGTLKIT